MLQVSELWWIAHSHSWFHVSVVVRRYFSLVQPTVLGSFQLSLVDVTMVVANRAFHSMHPAWVRFHEREQEWAHIDKQLLVGCIQKLTRSTGEVSTLIQTLRVFQDL